MKEAYNELLNIKDNDYVVIGVSGGPDSMALLHLLITVREKKNINIVCAHINHNIRKESEEEKLFVEDYCKKNNIIFEYMKIEKYKDDNFTEQEARNIRYKFFDDLMKKYNSKLLLTAHHGDDLIETILMRIVRGSTIRGYAGFSKIYELNGYKVMRPLIHSTKKEIEEYNKENNISFRLDYTNEKDEHTRNRYRHIVLPFLKREDKNVNKKFLKYSETLLEYSDYIDKQMLSIIDKIYSNNTLNIKKYKNLENIIQKRLINYIFENIYSNDLVLIKDTHFNLVNKLIYGNKPNGKVRLPLNIYAIRNYDEIVFKKGYNDNVSFDNKKIQLDQNISLSNNMRLIFLDSEDSNSNYICRLNSEDIKLPLYVRYKNDGDKIYVKGMSDSKKIKDIFINEKISINDRNKWPIVVDSNDNIVWIPGLKKSKYNKEKNEKYDIIIKYAKEEEK